MESSGSFIFWRRGPVWRQVCGRGLGGILLCAVVIAQLPQGVRAQEALANSVSQQAQNFAQRPGSTSGSTVERMFTPAGVPVGATASDEDLGEQWMFKRNEQPKAFAVFADTSAFYTSNVALARRGAKGDLFFLGDVNATYTRTLGHDLSFNAGLSESLFRYARFGEFDFDSFNVGTGLSWQARRLANINFSLQYNYNRLTRAGTFDEIFGNHSFTLAGVKAFQLSTADSVLIGASVAFNLAHPSNLERADVSLFAGYNLNLTRSLAANLNYRVAFFDYTTGSRRDLNQTLTAGLRWSIAKWFAVNASISGGYNYSNESAFRYHVLNLGVGLSGIVQF